MQTFNCPECGEESTYDPWLTSAQCPACGCVPPKKIMTGYSMSPEERRRIARLKSLRSWLAILLIAIVPSLIIIGIFGILPRLDIDARTEAYALLGIIGGVIGLLFLPTIVALFIVERLIARELVKSWRRLADRTGLTFNPKGGPGRVRLGSISGSYEGRQVEVFVQKEKRKLKTCATVSLTQPVVGELRLILSGNTTAEGRIPIREATFEQAVTVEGSLAAFSDEILADPELQERLLRIRRGSIIWLRSGVIVLQHHTIYGIERDMIYMTTMLETLGMLADAAEAASHRQLK